MKNCENFDTLHKAHKLPFLSIYIKEKVIAHHNCELKCGELKQKCIDIIDWWIQILKEKD